MRSVIFVNHGVGDVIMHLPLMRAVVAEPDDRALFVTRSRFEQAVIEFTVAGAGEFAFVDVNRVGEGRTAALARLARALRAQRPDCVALGIDVHPWMGAALAMLSGARVRVGPEAPWARHFFNRHLPYRDATRDRTHNVEYAVLAAQLLGRTATPSIRAPEARLRRVAEGAQVLTEGSGPLIGLAFGSGAGEAHKRPPLQVATRIVVALERAFPDATLVLLGGPAEAQLNDALAGLAQFRGLNLTGRTADPAQLLGVMANCQLLVSACNGVSHFAAVAGCPVVGLFGPTNHHVTGPHGVTLEVVSRGLACSPCYRRGYQRGCGQPVCMELDEWPVLEAVTRILKARHSGAVLHG
jgi:ADP-heptose:LPS heptosyltransferase